MKRLGAALKWLGLLTLLFGVVGTVWAVWLLGQVEAGWGTSVSSGFQGDYARAALASVLSSMFFVVAGAGLVLLSRPLEIRMKTTEEPGPPRWLLGLALVLAVYGLASICLATLLAGLAEHFDGAAVGIVSYCMVAGVGSLIAAWGLKRASDTR